MTQKQIEREWIAYKSKQTVRKGEMYKEWSRKDARYVERISSVQTEFFDRRERLKVKCQALTDLLHNFKKEGLCKINKQYEEVHAKLQDAHRELAALKKEREAALLSINAERLELRNRFEQEMREINAENKEAFLEMSKRIEKNGKSTNIERP